MPAPRRSISQPPKVRSSHSRADRVGAGRPFRQSGAAGPRRRRRSSSSSARTAACSTPISIRPESGGGVQRVTYVDTRAAVGRRLPIRRPASPRSKTRADPAPIAPLRRSPGRDRQDAARTDCISAAIAAVARRDQAVADHPVAPDPLDRRAGEHLAKRRHRRARAGRRAAARPVRRAAGRRGWPRPHRRSGSTGTPPGNRRSRRCGCRSPPRNSSRDRPVMLDRQIGDAAPRIDPVRAANACGRAGVEAARAAFRNARRDRAGASGVKLEAGVGSRRGTASCHARG